MQENSELQTFAHVVKLRKFKNKKVKNKKPKMERMLHKLRDIGTYQPENLKTSKIRYMNQNIN